jgi:hypothetical protein
MSSLFSSSLFSINKGERKEMQNTAVLSMKTRLPFFTYKKIRKKIRRKEEKEGVKRGRKVH